MLSSAAARPISMALRLPSSITCNDGFGSKPRRLNTAFDRNISGTLLGTFINADSKTCSDIQAFLQPQAHQAFLHRERYRRKNLATGIEDSLVISTNSQQPVLDTPSATGHHGDRP